MEFFIVLFAIVAVIVLLQLMSLNFAIHNLRKLVKVQGEVIKSLDEKINLRIEMSKIQAEAMDDLQFRIYELEKIAIIKHTDKNPDLKPR